MKSTNVSALALVMALAGSVVGVQADQKTDQLGAVLSKTAIAEVPAKSAELVALASVTDRDATALAVVKLTVKPHPTLATAIVGSISSKTAAASPTAAGTAAGLQPKQAIMIAHAAAKAAPAQAGAIVRAVCKAVPASFREVALVVASDCPTATKEILAGVSEAVPDQKVRLEWAMAGYHGKLPSVAVVLDRANSWNANQAGGPSPILASTRVRGPSVGPPYIPLSGTPSYVPPGGGIVPPGGRDYAAP